VNSQLGIPTANIPPEGLFAYPDLQMGVYYGVAALDPAKFKYENVHDGVTGEATTNATGAEAVIFPCVLSIGYNPFYKNKIRSVVRILISLFPNSDLYCIEPLPGNHNRSELQV